MGRDANSDKDGPAIGGWYKNSVLEYSHSVNRVKVRAMYEGRTYDEWHVRGNPSSIVDSKSWFLLEPLNLH